MMVSVVACLLTTTWLLCTLPFFVAASNVPDCTADGGSDGGICAVDATHQSKAPAVLQLKTAQAKARESMETEEGISRGVEPEDNADGDNFNGFDFDVGEMGEKDKEKIVGEDENDDDETDEATAVMASTLEEEEVAKEGDDEARDTPCQKSIAGCRRFLKKIPERCQDPFEKNAVRCCGVDGGKIHMKNGKNRYGCNKGKTFLQAEAVCAAKQLRLCTKKELLKTCGTGCGYDKKRVWFSSTGEAAEPNEKPKGGKGTKAPAAEPNEKPTGGKGTKAPDTAKKPKGDDKARDSSCRVSVAGCSNRRNLNKVPERCQDPGEKNDVKCCSKDGGKVHMTQGQNKYGCNKGKTFLQAKAICAAKQLRLCTKEELKSCAPGCGFARKRVWTSSTTLTEDEAAKGGKDTAKQAAANCDPNLRNCRYRSRAVLGDHIEKSQYKGPWKKYGPRNVRSQVKEIATEIARNALTPDQQAAPADYPIQGLTKYKFVPGTQYKRVDGRWTWEADAAGGKKCPKTLKVAPEDQLGPIALVLQKMDNRRKSKKLGRKIYHCKNPRKWRNGRYDVTLGTLESTNLSGEGNSAFFALTLGSPKVINARTGVINKGRQTLIYFKPNKGETDYTVHKWDASATEQLSLVHTITKDDVTKAKGGFVRTPINIAWNEETTTFVIAPASVGVSAWQQPIPGVEAAIVSSVNGVSVTAHRYDITKASIQFAPSPFDPALYGNRGGRRMFGASPWFPKLVSVSRNGSKSGGKRHGVVFQDEGNPNKMYVTWFGLGPGTTVGAALPTTMELKLPDPPANAKAQGGHWKMMGAASDGGSRLWVVVWSNGGYQKQPSRKSESDRRIIKFDSQTGAVELVKDFNSVDIVTPKYSKGSSVAYRPAGSNGQIGLIMSGGKRGGHQGGITVVFDAGNLNKLRERHSASHSQANRMTVSADGSKFIATESGDNFPRGLILHSFDQKSASSRLVFQPKTHHGSGPGGKPTDVNWKTGKPGGNPKNEPAPEFPGKYKHSNDNGVYHQLTNTISLDSGESLVFLRGQVHPSLVVPGPGEGSSGMGCIKVSKDFFKNKDTNYKKKCRDGLCRGYYAKLQADPKDFVFNDEVPSEEGGFYNYQGGWFPQSNHGVKWLTKDEPLVLNEEHLGRGRPKAVHIGDNKNLIMFEVQCGKNKYKKHWCKGDKVIQWYRQTMFMTVDDNCNMTREPQKFEYPVRLAMSDDVFVDKEAGTAVVYVGQGQNLMRYDISVSD